MPVPEEQFLPLFVANEEVLRAYARALLPSWEAVDDAMQEASLVMWRKLGQLREGSEFLPWAKVIVRFECLRARRTAARDRLCFGDDIIELLAESGADSPAEEELVAERRALDCCLGKLQQEQRDLVLLLYRGHGSVAARAEASGDSVNALYKQIRRLRAKITRCVRSELARNGHRSPPLNT